LIGGNPPTSPPHESAGVAWQRMNDLDVDYLVVVSDGRVAGLLAREDLRGPSGGTHRRMGRTAGDLMRRDFVSVTPETSIRHAAALMRRRRVGCLPVLYRGRLVGLLLVGTLLALLERELP
jgi:acetoin utilization protein AcuB